MQQQRQNLQKKESQTRHTEDEIKCRYFKKKHFNQKRYQLYISLDK